VEHAPFDLTNPHVKRFAKRLTNPLLQRLFLFAKLPAAWFMGVRIRHLDPEKASVSVPYGWRSQNPFQSIYFAAQAAAAEMSTGVLGLMAIEGRGNISILVGDIRGEFVKKATRETTFTCRDGHLIFEAVKKALETGEGVSVTCQSVGTQAGGETVSTFWVTWTFKKRNSTK
jgi:hypothetical protein